MEHLPNFVVIILGAITAFVAGIGATIAKMRNSYSQAIKIKAEAEAQLLLAEAEATRVKADAQSEINTNEAHSNTVAIDSANVVIETITKQYLAQAQQLKTLEEKYEALAQKFDLLKEEHESEMAEVKKEVEDCKNDREILVRIVKDNDVIIRDEDALRLGII